MQAEENVPTAPAGVELDPDVLSVVEFMQANVPCASLVAVAAGVGRLAPILWGHHPATGDLVPLRLVHPPISACDRRTRSAAT